MSYLDEYNGKIILVTGGAGLIGSNVVRKMVRLGAKKVLVLDNLSSSVKWNIPTDQTVVFTEGSVTDEEKLKRVFQERPDYVVHLAAHFANEKAVQFPEENLNVNALGTLKMLRWSQFVGVKRFIFASSGCATYGGVAPVPQ